MADQVRAYVDARKRCGAVFAALHRMHDVIASVGDILKRQPETLGFSGTAHSIPSEMNELVNSSEWPTVADLQGVLVQCHRTLADVQTAWASVPADDRASLQPPGNPWHPNQENNIRRLS